MSPNTAHNAFTISGPIKERYSRSFIVSMGIHVLVFLLVVFGQYLFPREVINIGSGIGGGMGGDISTVGVIDEFSGGAGMIKPSITPKPPALKEKPPENKAKAIPLPDTVEPRKKTVRQTQKSPKTETATNIVPTPAEPGSGGVGGYSGGGGGGIGGGLGVSIGTGSGSFGDHYYARTVEKRISDKWSRPPEDVRVEIIYSFYIDSYGRIQDIKKEKSSGNAGLDYMAERAIRAAKDIPAPPADLQGHRIQFRAQFVYPPD